MNPLAEGVVVVFALPTAAEQDLLLGSVDQACPGGAGC